MKITISILLLFVCFGCNIRESKASSTYKAKSITVNSTGRIADGQQDDYGFIVPDSQVSATTTPTLVTSIWGDKNDGVTKGVASFNPDDFNCDSGIVIDYDDYAKDTPVIGYLDSRDFIGWNKASVYLNDTDKPAKKSNTNNITVDGTGRISIGFNYSSTHPEYDTQKVIMLVCDTVNEMQFKSESGWYAIEVKSNHRTHWQYGYEVCEIITHADNVIELGLRHDCVYLDADKKPLSKSIIVWQTKELK